MNVSGSSFAPCPASHYCEALAGLPLSSYRENGVFGPFRSQASKLVDDLAAGLADSHVALQEVFHDSGHSPEVVIPVLTGRLT